MAQCYTATSPDSSLSGVQDQLQHIFFSSEYIFFPKRYYRHISQNFQCQEDFLLLSLSQK